MAKKTKVSTGKVTEDIKEVHLEERAQSDYYAYAVAANEDRAVPDALDGLKPGGRRGLWAVFKKRGFSDTAAQKSAKFVGETIGNYHPHGDQAIYDTYVNMVHVPMPLVDGVGNWGNFSDEKYAAMRYTNMRMTKYTENVFFDPFYLPSIKNVPNYDGTRKEPLIFPSLLPNLLLNGTMGIGVGIRTGIPTYTLESLVKVVKQVIAGTPCDAKMCMGLEFSSPHHGIPEINKAVRKELLAFYKSGTGALTFRSEYTLDKKKRVISIVKFAPFSNVQKCLEKVMENSHVQNANDASDIEDNHYLVQITLKKNVPVANMDKIAKALVYDCFSARVQYDVKTASRYVNGKDEAAAKLSSTTVPALINAWVKYRLRLEYRACRYWIRQSSKQIAYYELLRLAVKHRSLILKALDKKIDDNALAKLIAKSLKITVDQANLILDLKIRQLKALGDVKLVAQIKDHKERIKGWEHRRDKPAKVIPGQIDQLIKTILK